MLHEQSGSGPALGGHSIEGNHNRYRFCDVALGLRLDNGDILKLP